MKLIRLARPDVPLNALIRTLPGYAPGSITASLADMLAPRLLTGREFTTGELLSEIPADSLCYDAAILVLSRFKYYGWIVVREGEVAGAAIEAALTTVA